LHERVDGTTHRMLELQKGGTAVSTNNFRTPDDVQCRLKHIVQRTGAFKRGLKDTVWM
jgi:hypothetical protein